MERNFNEQVKALYEQSNEVIHAVDMLKANRSGEKVELVIPQDFKNAFFSLIDKVNLRLMEEKDNFYSYFLFQMSREIRFDISSPTAVNFKDAKYVIYFNPLIFLNLNLKQMESTIKHEILHIVSRHLIRAKTLKGRHSKLATNMAMDLVVNKFLDYLPPYAITVERVNLHYDLELKHYETFEYYVEKLQIALDLQEEDEEEGELYDDPDKPDNENIETDYNPEKTHDLWEESEDIDEKTMEEFTEQFVNQAKRGSIPSYIQNLVASLKESKGELPWNLYLNRLMGTIESHKKKTITRLSRRQPERLDLRGNLRSHKAEIAVALDISGSISDEEFKQAMKEVLSMVKNYKHQVTIIECDEQIRRVYEVQSIKDIQERMNKRGSTAFSPVFDYANKKKFNLLVYFTDGKGEDKLKVMPRGYKVLWVISGRGDQLSLKEPYGIVKKLKKIEVIDKELDMKDVRTDGYSMNHHEAIL